MLNSFCVFNWSRHCSVQPTLPFKNLAISKLSRSFWLLISLEELAERAAKFFFFVYDCFCISGTSHSQQRFYLNASFLYIHQLKANLITSKILKNHIWHQLASLAIQLAQRWPKISSDSFEHHFYYILNLVFMEVVFFNCSISKYKVDMQVSCNIIL